MGEVADLLAGSAPLYQQTIYDTIVTGWLDGAEEVATGLPTRPFQEAIDALSPPPPDTPSGASVFWPDDEPPIVRFPNIDRAVELLRSREVVSSDEFYELAAAARQQAFTITADLTESTLVKIRDRLADVVEQGPSLRAFREAIIEDFETLPLAPAHLEQVYRNNVNEAFSQGMDAILNHPLVEDGFPYRVYHAIHDARARVEHRSLERYGLDGTAVYHKDDPTWRKFQPPWDFGCRCGWTAISVETAASMGVREAQEWMRAGIEPAHTWVTPPPFEPSPGWARAEVAAV